MPLSSDRSKLQEILRDEDLKIKTVSSAAEASQVLARKPPSVIIYGDKLPGADWREFLTDLHDHGWALPTIIAAEHADERLWADVLNRGGFDLLQRPFEEQEVRRVVAMARRYGATRTACAS
jgi:DNA-binding NtrC family response regulator